MRKIENLPVITLDPAMKGYVGDIRLRMENYEAKRKALLSDGASLSAFSNGHHYFGFHRNPDGSTVYREWAPGADALFFYGDFNGWNGLSHPMTRLENGVYEITLSGNEALKNGQKCKVLVRKDGETREHIPTYATYVTQDPVTYIWSAEVHFAEGPFEWHDAGFQMPETPFVYECHVGMATEEYRIGTYREFRENVLPRVEADGYNTIQIMAVMEHPYYASFGYQVSNFFAASSRYGVPEDLKALVDEAHRRGIAVLLDVVHSHAVRNEREGLNRFDGTDYQFFHAGPEGDHPAWGTKLFDYGKNEVLHFLLSNLKFWMEEYHFDGFRFDGVTSMLYHDHGLGTAFDHYDKYFSMNTDVEAVTYLMLANELIHEINPNAITIAEDMSGMPGMCLPVPDGGIGFDYRLAMGMPDLWIRYVKDTRDEDWNLGKIYGELTGHRPKEKVIGYAESHDQALVGDQTLMFRLAGEDMYWFMRKEDRDHFRIDRAIALHKVIRLLTFSLSPNGYLNFMGNEFGHPEWIDFPREGNGWSYAHARRQWSLADNRSLKYSELGDFDRTMLYYGKQDGLFREEAHCLKIHEDDKILIHERAGRIFTFNLHVEHSYFGYFVPVTEEGSYEVEYTTDDYGFGGYDRIDHRTEFPTFTNENGELGFFAYLPSRTATVFRKKNDL